MGMKGFRLENINNIKFKSQGIPHNAGFGVKDGRGKGKGMPGGGRRNRNRGGCVTGGPGFGQGGGRGGGRNRLG